MYLLAVTSKQLHLKFYLKIYLLLVLFSGCGVYSFTGASISPEVKSISIQYFPNNAPLIEATLSQSFTDALRDKFVSQTNLTLVNSGGDLSIEGEITDYNTKPLAIQANEVAALNSLTITVNVTFVNNFDETKNFETKFTQYLDYPSNKNLSDVKETLINQITEMIVEDIFNKAVVNW
ncbi:MAG: LptE family protein [Bacteroidales bacterium]|nr:LptE family protein [Bacteroidales bacterium]